MIPHSKPFIDENEQKAVQEVMSSTYISEGTLVRQFEENLAKYVAMPYAIAVNSGTSALHLALVGLGIGKGDEVLIPSYVCTAVLNAVKYTGAIPVLVDIDVDDLNISSIDIERKISKRTKVVVVPHMFGYPAKINEIVEISRKRNLFVIEDCAQAVGATCESKYLGEGGNEEKKKRFYKKVGSFGDISIFSFYATKMLTTGQGGMILVKHKSLEENIRDLKDYDKKERFRLRYNYSMTDLQAAIGLTQLSRFNAFITRRKVIAHKYQQAFSNAGIKFMNYGDKDKGVYYRFVIFSESLDESLRRLREAGVICERPVYKPIHYYLNSFNEELFPNTENIYRRALSIPIYPALKDNEIDKVIGEILKRGESN